MRIRKRVLTLFIFGQSLKTVPVAVRRFSADQQWDSATVLENKTRDQDAK
jgi:hypothetical protein